MAEAEKENEAEIWSAQFVSKVWTNNRCFKLCSLNTKCTYANTSSSRQLCFQSLTPSTVGIPQQVRHLLSGSPPPLCLLTCDQICLFSLARALRGAKLYQILENNSTKTKLPSLAF